MRTLVIGSSGFLGRVVTERLRRVTSVLPTHCQNPVFPRSRTFDILKDDVSPLLEQTDAENTGVESVVFCAGFEQDSDADALEPAMAHLLRACGDRRFVYLSSDAVFTGDRGRYREDETPVPVTAYGRNLLVCETLVRDHCPNHLILRPSYIYGFSRGDLDPRLSRTLSAVRKGNEVRLFADMFKSPLGVLQVAEAVAALSMDAFTGTLHIAGPRLSVLEFHRAALAALGYPDAPLVGVPMPEGSGFQRDTTLDTGAWQRLSGTRVLTVAETLRAHTV